jgi:CubicO group peptidase (beta-lactamase class C family)
MEELIIVEARGQLLMFLAFAFFWHNRSTTTVGGISMFMHERLGATVVTFALAVFFSIAARAADLPISTPEKVGMSSERLKRMNDVIHAYVDKGRTPGVVTLIARHGKIVHVDAYGIADQSSGRKMRARRPAARCCSIRLSAR